MFKLASMFVSIEADDKALKSQIGGVQKQLGTMGVAIGSAVGNLAATAISSAASALAGFLSKGIIGAANLGESLSKVDAAFGNSGSAIKDTADELAKAYGLSKQSILDAGAAIGLVGKGAGQSKEQAAQLGSSMAKLAADAASFYNVPLDEALNKIRSGLIGEAEPLRAFGVLLTEEAVAAEAVALGLAKSTKEVDNQAKVAARTSLITKGLADATGDLERTQNSTANQFRKFTGSIENLAVSIGEKLAPATQETINLLNELTGLITGAKGGGDFFGDLGKAAAAAVNAIRQEIRNFGSTVKILKLESTNLFGQNDAAIAEIRHKIFIDELKLATEESKRNDEALKAAAKRAEAQEKALQISKDQAAVAAKEKQDAEAAKRIADELGRKHAEHLKAQARAAAEAAHKEKAFESQTFGVAQFAEHLQSQIFSPQDIQKQQLEAAKKTAEKTSIIAEEIVKPRGALAIMA